MANPLYAKRSDGLNGVITVPGDKSISHRALILGALSTGSTNIRGLLEAEDIIKTVKALTALGVAPKKIGDTWHITGVGTSGLMQPEPAVLDFGNSGTGVRLMLGVLAGHNITVKCVGDKSLSRRPIGRVISPLKRMGLNVHDLRDTLPLRVTGTSDLIPIEYNLPVPSAQVKSAVLLAGIQARGTTSVIEKEATRDHTELMLQHFGVKVYKNYEGGKIRISVDGHTEMSGRDVLVPGDPSAAAFLAAAAVITPGSDILLLNILYNSSRIGFYLCLQEMGADVVAQNHRVIGGEVVVDLRVRGSKLQGIVVPQERAPSMIDEYPILAVVAAFAAGKTVMEGLHELKFKESDRLSATAAGLIANGIDAIIEDTTLTVIGAPSVLGGGIVMTNLDHRIAMAFLVLGQGTIEPVTIDDGDIIATSFPGFCSMVQNIGGNVEPIRNLN
ncbi:MAG: 3-phosphoshikimate 1-carboxyvinyltransferase [Hyphomicrobiaceae bacterium hypho_1]